VSSRVSCSLLIREKAPLKKEKTVDVITAITGRRSIRQYKGDPIEDGDLAEVLEAVRWAPSWANTQSWEIIIVKDPEAKRKLADTLPAGNPACSSFNEAPVVIVACARRGKAGYFKGAAVTDKGDWYMFDVALAMQNLTLAAYARGLGTVLVGFFDANKVAHLLNIPEDVAVVAMTPLGYPDREAKPTPRKALHDFVSYDTFGCR
jgi:nitroreductase